jgi:hypothetical protein
MQGKIIDMKTAKRCFENVIQLKYLGTTVTKQNFIQEAIMKETEFG